MALDAAPANGMNALAYRLQLWLLLLTPVRLFRRLSELAWYDSMLQEWIGEYIGGNGSRALDVGCATGYLSRRMHQRGCRVSGIDRSRTMIAEAKRSNPDIDFGVGDATRLPYPHATFDLVAAASLINIVADPDALVRDMIRVCKDKGYITVLFPAKGFNDNHLRRYVETNRIAGFSQAVLMFWHRTASKMDVDRVIALFAENGLCACETRYYLGGMVASVCVSKQA